MTIVIWERENGEHHYGPFNDGEEAVRWGTEYCDGIDGDWYWKIVGNED